MYVKFYKGYGYFTKGPNSVVSKKLSSGNWCYYSI